MVGRGKELCIVLKHQASFDVVREGQENISSPSLGEEIINAE